MIPVSFSFFIYISILFYVMFFYLFCYCFLQKLNYYYFFFFMKVIFIFSCSVMIRVSGFIDAHGILGVRLTWLDCNYLFLHQILHETMRNWTQSNALFKNMRILKFKSHVTFAFFAAFNRISRTLRKQNFTSSPRMLLTSATCTLASVSSLRFRFVNRSRQLILWYMICDW